MTTTPVIVVIGAGPGGEAAAKEAARRGARVTLVERGDLGGLCLNRGCVPSKILLEAAHARHLARVNVDVFDGTGGLHINWPALQERRARLLENQRGALAQNMSRLKIEVLVGEARFDGGRTVSVQTAAGVEKRSFDYCLLSTGSESVYPPPFDVLRDKAWTSDQALATPTVPQKLLVVGGGAIGCEFSCLYNELGSQVTLVEMTPSLLPGEDLAVSRALQSSFEKRGILVFTGVTVQQATLSGFPADFLRALPNEPLEDEDEMADNVEAKWVCYLSNGNPTRADEILLCAGRRPRLEELGLEAAGIKVERGRPVVNEYFQTSQPRVYAVGDANGLSLLAHAAAAQAETAVAHAYNEKICFNRALVPRCLYTWPEVASVGEYAEDAKARGVETKSKRFFFQGSAKALAKNETEGFIQILSSAVDDKIIGAQIVGPQATELIHVFSVALKGAMTTSDLRQVVFAHPTLCEGIKEALSR